MKPWASRIVLHLIAWLIGLIWIIPYLGVFIASIRPYSEIVNGWWNTNPLTITFDAYLSVWNHKTYPLSNAFVNSLLIAIPSTIIPIFVASLAAYAFARFRFPTRDMIFLTIVALMSLPQQAVIIPTFFLMKDLHLLNTRLGLILLHSAFGLPWIILFLRNFFMTLPVEIEEAAKIDGASDFQIFYKIVLPISLPALASVSALQFNWVWNDFFFALILLLTPEKYVVTQTIPAYIGRYEIRWDQVAAASVMSMTIPLLIFALLQKYYVKGIIGGVIKG